MSSVEDAQLRRALLHEVAKRPIDLTQFDLHVTRGVVYLTGIIQPPNKAAIDMTSELEKLTTTIKNRPGVRDVVMQARLKQR